MNSDGTCETSQPKINHRTELAIRRVHSRLLLLGFNPRQLLSAVKGVHRFRRDRREYLRQVQADKESKDFEVGTPYPIVGEWSHPAGHARGHYFHQDLLVAREIFKRQPQRHVDVGSSIYGFVSHVAAFRDIEVLDIRPLTSHVQGINFIQADLMKDETRFHQMTDSLSCLHALEHFGLGRYGDKVDIHGWRKGLTSLTNMISPGGTLYLSVPTGRHQRVEFNAHRVFSIPFLREVLQENFRVERLAFVTDSGELVPEVDLYSNEADLSFAADYGCSIWILRK